MADSTRAWMELWELALGDADSGSATIAIDDDPYVVTLQWPDGSFGVWAWRDGAWCCVGSGAPDPATDAATQTGMYDRGDV